MSNNNLKRIKVKYERTGRLKQPMISATLSYGNKITPVKFLLDSGATYSIVNYRFAELLGMDIDNNKPAFTERIVGYSGIVEQHKFYNINTEVAGWKFEMPVAFCRTSWNLFGRYNAFQVLSPIVFVESQENSYFILGKKERKNEKRNIL